jgi:hypothetical protein
VSTLLPGFSSTSCLFQIIQTKMSSSDIVSCTDSTIIWHRFLYRFYYYLTSFLVQILLLSDIVPWTGSTIIWHRFLYRFYYYLTSFLVQILLLSRLNVGTLLIVWYFVAMFVFHIINTMLLLITIAWLSMTHIRPTILCIVRKHESGIVRFPKYGLSLFFKILL